MMICLKVSVFQESVATASFFAAILVGTHVFALFASMAVYRLLLHPLRQFPGPLDMRLSKLSHVARLLVRGCKNYEILEELRIRYGDSVRTGMPLRLFPVQ